MTPKEGDRVAIKTKDKELEGVLLPSTNKNSIVLKLDSGYNVGINKTSAKSIEVIKKYKQSESKKNKVKHSKDKKTVAILHTGGTIASKVDYETGGVIARYSPEELVAMFPEIEKLVNVNSRLISNMFSEDMRFGHYNIIAKEIEKEVKAGVDGIILTHGTDTLHYTSAALSFILEDLPVPVILVGAQRSSDRGSSDAAMNLISAIEFITNSDFGEVAICMHEDVDDDLCSILPGLKARKMHTSRRDAFQSINANSYAEIDYIKRKITWVRGDYQKADKKRKLKLKPFKEVKVGLVKMRPNMFHEELKPYTKFDGLVLEGSGLGHWPINKVDKLTKGHVDMRDGVKKLAKKMPVVMTSQTIHGRINMNVYSTGRDLQELGVIGNFLDMTPETAYIKLAWLLSNHPKEVKELFSKNLRGEINERITTEYVH